MKIAIGSDHKGHLLKKTIISTFPYHEWTDVGTQMAEEKSDYPVYGHAVSGLILQEKVERGILLCGTGIGMSIVANRYKGIYAALCWNDIIAKFARQHDNSNILIIPASHIKNDQAIKMVNVWLCTSFLEGIYRKRLDLIDIS